MITSDEKDRKEQHASAASGSGMGSRPSTGRMTCLPGLGGEAPELARNAYLNLHSAKIFEIQNFHIVLDAFLGLMPFVMLSSSYQRNILEMPPACRQLSPSLHTEFRERSVLYLQLI